MQGHAEHGRRGSSARPKCGRDRHAAERASTRERSEALVSTNGNHYGRPLTVKVKDGQLLIAIGIQTLAHAVSYADWANPYDEAKQDYIRTFAITDVQAFAEEVAHMMQDERE